MMFIYSIRVVVNSERGMEEFSSKNLWGRKESSWHWKVCPNLSFNYWLVKLRMPIPIRKIYKLSFCSHFFTFNYISLKWENRNLHRNPGSHNSNFQPPPVQWRQCVFTSHSLIPNIVPDYYGLRFCQSTSSAWNERVIISVHQ